MASRSFLRNWRDRLAIAMLFLALFTLVDELVKEGYIFDYRDLYTGFPTHEQLFVAFLAAGLILGARKWC